VGQWDRVASQTRQTVNHDEKGALCQRNDERAVLRVGVEVAARLARHEGGCRMKRGSKWRSPVGERRLSVPVPFPTCRRKVKGGIRDSDSRAVQRSWRYMQTEPIGIVDIVHEHAVRYCPLLPSYQRSISVSLQAVPATCPNIDLVVHTSSFVHVPSLRFPICRFIKIQQSRQLGQMRSKQQMHFGNKW
jgi:hypothetical protein